VIQRKNVEYAKQIFNDRLGDDYVYGGTFDPNDIKAGADCSGLVTDELGALFFGTGMHWDREGLSTESYRYKDLGPQRIGPFDLVHVAHWQDIPADAVATINLHHEGEGGPDSHMNVIIDGVYMEESGTYGCCTAPKAIPKDNTYWNDWYYVPGPIVEDGTPLVTNEPTDTIFADVSEFQVPVDDSYPYQVLSIRVCDGTYQDHNFAQNYAWMKGALDSGKLTAGIVYVFVRPNWQQTANTIRNMFGDNGGVHPKVVLMLDVESGNGNPSGDGSDWIDALYANLVDLVGGDPRRVIGYGNVSDLNSMWITKPSGERLIVASYGSNPDYPNKIAHQYTDGKGYGGGLPEGCSPFGNCDMNSADGISPSQFAAACGIATTPSGGGFLMALTDAQQQEIYDRICGQRGSRSAFRPLGQGDIGDAIDFVEWTDGSQHVELTIRLAEYGDPDALALITEIANADLTQFPDRASDKALAQRVLARLKTSPVVHVENVNVAPVHPVPEAPKTAPAAPGAPSAVDLAAAITGLAELFKGRH